MRSLLQQDHRGAARSDGRPNSHVLEATAPRFCCCSTAVHCGSSFDGATVVSLGVLAGDGYFQGILPIFTGIIGNGKYPTISPFSYSEHLRITHEGRPFFFYQQKTLAFDGTSTPLHTEVGYLKLKPGNLLEMSVCDPTGIAMIMEGSFDPGSRSIKLLTKSVALSSWAKEVREVRRQLEVKDGSLSYTLQLAAVGQPLQEHLQATLTREEEAQ